MTAPAESQRVTYFFHILEPSTVAVVTSVAYPIVTPRLSIVLLPFANLSNKPKQ